MISFFTFDDRANNHQSNIDQIHTNLPQVYGNLDIIAFLEYVCLGISFILNF